MSGLGGREETVWWSVSRSIRFHERGPGADAAPVEQPVPSRSRVETPPDSWGALPSLSGIPMLQAKERAKIWRVCDRAQGKGAG
ncbi:MAG: hypothetical protein ACLVHV_11060 [Oscillospiraceae bacterium]